MNKDLERIQDIINIYKEKPNKNSFNILKKTIKEFYKKDYIFINKRKEILKLCDFEKCRKEFNEGIKFFYNCKECEEFSYYCSQKCLDIVKNIDLPCKNCRKVEEGCYGIKWDDVL